MTMIPLIHASFLNQISNWLKSDTRIAGLAVGGSYMTQDMDEFSDLDLVIAVEPAFYTEVMNSRMTIVAGCGHLLSAFTGEHVGEPRLIIALYEEAGVLLHVDFKFVASDQLSQRIENPIVIWARNLCFADAITMAPAVFPMPSYQWFEDRFWIWVHYAAIKIGRGELFETIEFISFLRQTVIGPLLQIKEGQLPKGVRKIEWHAPEMIPELKKTIASHDAIACVNAMETIIDLYLMLRDSLYGPEIERKTKAEAAVCHYLQMIKKKR
jgi:predicted nucleotidyltransferase